MGPCPLGLLSPLNHQFLVVQPVLSMEIKFPISVHYNDYPEGGHFAIHERAEEMAADLREFFRPLRHGESQQESHS